MSRAAGLVLVLWLSAAMPVHAELLGSAVARCAPQVAPRTALAIIAVESSGRWWAVNDNDRPTPDLGNPQAAIAYAQQRIAEGGNLDLGLTQLNSSHLREFHVSVTEAFEPCTNIALGMHVLQAAWLQAQARWGATREALYHAFEAYNGGAGVWRSNDTATRAKVARYAALVWDTARDLAPPTAAAPRSHLTLPTRRVRPATTGGP